GDGAIDQPRVARRELLVVDPEPLGDAWPVFLDDNVGVPGEAKVDFLARSALEIDPDRLLVAAKRVVRRAAEAVDRPLRAGGAGLLRASSGGRSRLLDLDHFSAKVRQDHRAERPRRELGQVEYFDSVQWCGHRGAPRQTTADINERANKGLAVLSIHILADRTAWRCTTRL